MKIRYWGTAAAEGIPALFCRCAACRQARAAGGKNVRTRSQALIDGVVLIDFPPDTNWHAQKNLFDLSVIRRLLITHSHYDHFHPEEILARCGIFAHEPIEPLLHIYANTTVISVLRRYCDEVAAWRRPYERLCLHQLTPFVPVEFDGYRVTPLPANHMDESEETALIYVIEKDGRTLLYGNDSGYFREDTWAALEGFRFDMISLDCTLGDKYPGTQVHMDLARNKAVRVRLEKAGCVGENTRCVITHISHNALLCHEELEALAAEIGYGVAFDGMEAEV